MLIIAFTYLEGILYSHYAVIQCVLIWEGKYTQVDMAGIWLQSTPDNSASAHLSGAVPATMAACHSTAPVVWPLATYGNLYYFACQASPASSIPASFTSHPFIVPFPLSWPARISWQQNAELIPLVGHKMPLPLKFAKRPLPLSPATISRLSLGNNTEAVLLGHRTHPLECPPLGNLWGGNSYALNTSFKMKCVPMDSWPLKFSFCFVNCTVLFVTVNSVMFLLNDVVFRHFIILSGIHYKINK